MKQDKVTKSISVLLLAAVILYIGINVLTALLNPFKTAYAVEFETYDMAEASAYTVREETVIYSNSDIISLTRAEGEKVGVGQTVAYTYRDENAEARQGEIDAARARLEQLQYAASGSVSLGDAAKLDGDILGAIINLNSHVNSHSLSGTSAAATKLKTLVFARSYLYDDSGSLETEITNCEAQLKALQALSSDESSAITASVSGVYSSYVDGYETVLTPAVLDSMTVTAFNEISSAASSVKSSVGKLVTSSRWYLLTVMDEDDAVRLGSSVRVRFAEGAQLDMDVDRVGLSDKGRSVVVLSSDMLLSDITAYRSVYVDIIFDIYSGLRIPKGALRMDKEGNTMVYIVEANNVKLKYVNIISKTGDYYLVEEDTSSTDNLWAGDEVIVAGRNLYDGKVVE